MKPDDCLNKWFQSLTRGACISLESSAHVIGRVDIPLGGRSHIAGIEFTVIGANTGPTWSTIRQLEPEELINYVEPAIFGFLDVCLTQYISPISGIHIEVVKLEIHPVHSSSIAFRLAGREAARVFLQKLKKHPSELEIRLPN